MCMRFRSSFLKITGLGFLMLIASTGLTMLEAGAEENAPAPKGHGDMDAIGKKLANPLADLWGLNFKEPEQ